MKLLVKAAVVAAVAAASAGANAAQFDFDYTFSDGQTIVGAFNGVTSDGGQSVTDITNLQVSFNGVAFAPVTTGGVTLGNALQIQAWSPSGGGAFVDTTPATIYANGSLNNFVISDVDAATSQAANADYEFAYINDSTNGIFQAVAANFLQSDSFSGPGATQLDIDSPAVAAKWTLTEVAAPVPVPAALPLFLSGLGLFVGARRRRSA